MNTQMEKPYVGPRTFQESERDRFFGRDREARDLLALAISEPMVLFYAQSGAGKSSLVNTCLIPDLKSKGFGVFSGRVAGDAPVGIDVDNIYVFNLVRSLLPNEVNLGLLAKLSISEFFSDAVDHTLHANPTQDVRPHVLIIDQFEELFNTHHEAWEKRGEFFRQLEEAMEADPYLWAIFVMREDFIAALDPYAYMLPSRLRMRYYMQRLERDAALEAVKKPVRDLRPFAGGVAETLVDNLARINIKLPDGSLDSQPGQYVEPVQLQVVCYSLWENLKSDRPYITEDDLREVGDVNQSLEKFYDVRVGTVANEKNVEERLIREWFDYELITISGTRNMVLRNLKNDGGLDDKVIQALQGDLVRAEMRGGQIWYELSHDRLIEPVHASNTKWFAANLSFFQQQAALWVAQDRSEGLLLRGKELEQAELEQSKREAESKTTPKDELDFLAASKKAREREKREKRGNLLVRFFAGGATIFMIAAILLAFQARIQAIKADEEKRKAEIAVVTAAYAQSQAEDAINKLAKAGGLVEADALAGQAQIALSQSDTIQLGRLLSVEAYNTNKVSGEILPGVYQALVNSVAEENDLLLSTRPFTSAAFNFASGGNRLVVDNELWDLENIQVSKLDPDSKEVMLSSFLSDEQVVTIVQNTDYFSSDQNPYNANIINITNREVDQIPLIVPIDSFASALSLSDNSRWVALAFSSPKRGGVLFWDVQNPYQDPGSFNVQFQNVRDLAISQDGKNLAVVDDKYLYFWQNAEGDYLPTTNILLADFELDRGFKSGSFSGKSGRGLQYSPDGRWLAMQTQENIYVFDPKAQQLINGTPPSSADEITGFLFSPDSKYLVYVVKGNQTSSVYRWRLDNPNPKSHEIYKSTSVDVTTMDISKSGKLMIGDEAGYVRTWDINQDSKVPLQVVSVHSGKIINLLIGPDEQTIVSSNAVDGTRLWKLNESGSEAVIEHRIPSTVSSIIRSVAGDILVVGGIKSDTDLGTIRIYSNLQNPDARNSDLSFDSGSGSSLQALAVTSKWVAAVRTDKGSFYSDASYFLDFWDRAPADEKKSFVSFTLPSEVSSMAFYPNGQDLVTATVTGEIWIYDTTDLSRLMGSMAPTPEGESSATKLQMPHSFPLPNDLADIRSLVFTQDGRYLIGASTTGVRIWEMSKISQRPYQLPNAVYPALISPDQKWLVAASSDNTIQLYSLDNILSSPTIIPVDKTLVTRFAFDQKDGWLAVANKTGDVSIYKIPVTEYPINPTYTLQGPYGEITSLEFSPVGSRGNWLAASGGSSVYLWNMTNPNRKPITLPSQGSVVYAGFTNDGEWIITSSTDQILEFWSMDLDKMSKTACKFAERNFSHTEWNRYFPERGDLQETCKGFGYDLEQLIAVTGSGATPTPFSTLSVIQPTATPVATPTSAGNFEYTVQQGDLLAVIAIKFNVDINILIADNGIENPNLIVPGQILKIRVPGGTSP